MAYPKSGPPAREYPRPTHSQLNLDSLNVLERFMNRINSLAKNEDSVVVDASGRAARHDGAFRGKRISWAEFYAQRPDLRPDNDNRREAEDAA